MLQETVVWFFFFPSFCMFAFCRFASGDELIGRQFITNGMENRLQGLFFTPPHSRVQQFLPKDALILKVCTEPVATWHHVTQPLNAVIESDVLARNKMFDDLIHQVSPDRYLIDKCYH